jgi:phosphatidylglycerophosphate synthase
MEYSSAVCDTSLRRRLSGPLDRAARPLARAGIRADAVTMTGLVVGLGACVAAGSGWWCLALVLWWSNRILDGLDGPLARVAGATDRGGFLDIVADFTVYGGFVVGVAVAIPDARLACVVLFASYYVSGVAFLAWSSTAERRGRERSDERSLHFVSGIAEGAETIVAYSLFCLFPQYAPAIAWTFAVLVAITALQRIVWAYRWLSVPDETTGGRF